MYRKNPKECVKNCVNTNILCYNVGMNVISKLPMKILIGVVTIALACVSAATETNNDTAFEKKAFIAGDKPAVQIYEMNAQGGIEEAKTVPRGTEVTLRDEDLRETAEGEFYRIDLDCENSETGAAETDADHAGTGIEGLSSAMIENTIPSAAEMRTALAEPSPAEPPLYVRPENLADSREDVVQEKELFVRTPVTIYQNSEGPVIAGFLPKGTRLEVTGFAGLDKSGEVAKYKVRRYDDSGEQTGPEGFAYSKYLVRTQDEADANYNEHGEYDKAKKAKYGMDLHGGKATGLDYYPFERVKIEGNDFCREARAMYLNYYAALHYKPYVKIIKETKCNAVVIDVKDGALSYKSPVAKELAPTAYRKAHVEADVFAKEVKDFKAAVKEETGRDIYIIARIACFNDKYYAKDHPENCIKTQAFSAAWPSAYCRDVWYYNVALAIDAIERIGFDEIQFDYVRFPEASYEMSLDKSTVFRNKYDESKAQAIQNFCFYAADQIHEAGAYFSVDVFGECSDGYVTAYGQYWPAISNVVDAISSMPYTDHFGDADTWSEPKAVMKVWAKGAAKGQEMIPTPAAARTWITGYNTPFWAPQVTYDKQKLRQQVDALYEAGLDGGFIPWNSASSADAYRLYRGIWDYEK